MITFTTPLAAVMFPKVVQSAARTAGTDAVRHALIATALLGGAAAVACTLFPALPVRIIYFRNPLYWRSAELIPWFAWCLLPLILANVLISNLLARRKFRVVPWLVVVAAGYGLALSQLQDRLTFFTEQDIQKPGLFAERLAKQTDPPARWIWSHLDSGEQARIDQAASDPVQARSVLVAAFNRLLRSGTMGSFAEVGGVSFSAVARKQIEANPAGRSLIALNRLLMQEAFPNELASAEAKMFKGFKTVIGTLGIFSSMLLLVVLWFTTWMGCAANRALERPGAEQPAPALG
jgi:hypothetical protein